MIKHENGHLLMSQAGATSGNDYVSAYEGYMFFGLEGHDRFIHAAGDDVFLSGGQGNDLYRFHDVGNDDMEGSVFIYENVNEGHDTLVLGDIDDYSYFSLNGQDLVFSDQASGATVTILDGMNSLSNIESIQFQENGQQQTVSSIQFLNKMALNGAYEGDYSFDQAVSTGKLDSALTGQEYQQVTEHFIETVELSGVTNYVSDQMVAF